MFRKTWLIGDFRGGGIVTTVGMLAKLPCSIVVSAFLGLFFETVMFRRRDVFGGGASYACWMIGYSQTLLVESQYSHRGFASSHLILSRLQLKQPVRLLLCVRLVCFGMANGSIYPYSLLEWLCKLDMKEAGQSDD
jgi:hypothetical protein